MSGNGQTPSDSKVVVPISDYRKQVFEAERFIKITETSYRMNVPEHGLVFEIERVKRDHRALYAYLTVTCSLPGARTRDGVLREADINLLGPTIRTSWAKYLTIRTNSREDIDYEGLLEELTVKVVAADREGDPSVDLRDVPDPGPETTLKVEGLQLLAENPTILFGDGGSFKSFVALYLVGKLAQQGLRVGYMDWELSKKIHRRRLGQLFPEGMPSITYRRLSAPLVESIEVIAREASLKRLNYIVFDSIVFACAPDEPERAATAAAYFQAIRSLGPIGTLHLAHTTKAEGADEKPFGSTFWHNGAQATWFVQKADGALRSRKSIALFNKKANLAELYPPVSWNVDFGQSIRFSTALASDTPEFEAKLALKDRIAKALRPGSKTVVDIVSELGLDCGTKAKRDNATETVRSTVKRYKDRFVEIDASASKDGIVRWGLARPERPDTDQTDSR